MTHVVDKTDGTAHRRRRGRGVLEDSHAVFHVVWHEWMLVRRVGGAQCAALGHCQRRSTRGGLELEPGDRHLAPARLESQKSSSLCGACQQREVFVFCYLSGEPVPLGLRFVADSISAGFPRKEHPLMLHRAFSIEAEKSKTKARFVSITRNSLSTLIRYCTLRRSIPHPTRISHTRQDFRWLPVVRGLFPPKCPAFEDATENAVPLIECTSGLPNARTAPWHGKQFLQRSSDKPIRGSGGRTWIAADRAGETIDTGVLEQDGTGNYEEVTGDDGTTSGSTVLTGRRKLFARRRKRVYKQTSALVQGRLQDVKKSCLLPRAVLGQASRDRSAHE